MVQLRDKISDTPSLLDAAGALRTILARTKTPLIINDRLDIALIAGADGLHIGQSDVSLAIARRILGPDKIIGVSCATLPQALAAQKGGADYIGAGAVFRTPTKPEAKPLCRSQIIRMHRRLSIPLFVLGGITPRNLPGLVSMGLRRVAVCRGICRAKNVSRRTRLMKQLLLT